MNPAQQKLLEFKAGELDQKAREAGDQAAQHEAQARVLRDSQARYEAEAASLREGFSI